MKTLQFREAIAEAMSEEMRRDETIYLMGEEVAEYNGAYKASKGMLDEFGAKRVIDTPISEMGFSGIGVGSAMNGNRPIIEFMTFNFSLVAMDQLVNSAAKMLAMSGGQYNVPIVFRGPTGNAGQLGATHSSNFENWFANTPGLKVVVPSNPYDAKGLLKASIRDNDPVIFMESELMYSDRGNVPDEEYLLPIGVAEVKRKGKDVTLISFGKMMKVAFEAADQLAKDHNLEAEVIDLRTVRPIDYPTLIESVKKTNRCVIVEEATPVASLATDMAFIIQKDAFDYLDAPVLRVNSMDVPLSYAPTYIEATLPNVKRTMEALKRVCYIQ